MLAVRASLLDELVEALNLVYLKLPPDYLLRVLVCEKPARARSRLSKVDYLSVLVKKQLLIASYRHQLFANWVEDVQNPLEVRVLVGLLLQADEPDVLVQLS